MTSRTRLHAVTLLLIAACTWTGARHRSPEWMSVPGAWDEGFCTTILLLAPRAGVEPIGQWRRAAAHAVDSIEVRTVLDALRLDPRDYEALSANFNVSAGSNRQSFGVGGSTVFLDARPAEPAPSIEVWTGYDSLATKRLMRHHISPEANAIAVPCSLDSLKCLLVVACYPVASPDSTSPSAQWSRRIQRSFLLSAPRAFRDFDPRIRPRMKSTRVMRRD